MINPDGTMNILLLGSGGREAAMAWKMSQSPLTGRLYIAPGNGGTSSCGINLPIDPTDAEAVDKAVVEYCIDMVVGGSEAPSWPVCATNCWNALQCAATSCSL